MTTQQTLFPDERPAKLARDADPETSHAAAAEVLPKLSKLEKRVLYQWRVSGPLTANEAADSACLCVWLDDNSVGHETYRKRYTGLLKKSRIIADGKKRCNITGKLATVYRITEESND